MTSIGSYAFYGCTSLASVTIPIRVTSIGYAAFRECRALTSIIIPEGVTRIESETFNRCTSLTSIIIPQGVTSIGNNAFEYCRSLTSIMLPECVTSIGKYAFSDCDSLTSITIPEGVVSIEEGLFFGCVSLTTITIHKNLTSVKSYAFYQSGLTDVYFIGSRDETNIREEYGGTPNSWSYSISNAVWHYVIPDFAVTSTASSATITAPEGGWVEGENTFTVASENACFVAVSYDGGQTYTRLAATKSGDAYAFTAANMDADTIIAVSLVGDLNGDGRIRAQEARQVLQASSGSAELTALQIIAADLNGDGRIRAQEARTLLQASSGSATLSW